MGRSAEEDWEDQDVPLRDQGAGTLFQRCVGLFFTNGRLFLSILLLIVFPLLTIDQAITEAIISAEKRSITNFLFHRLGTHNSKDFKDHLKAIALAEDIASTAARLIAKTLYLVPHICIVYSVAAILSDKAIVFADAIAAVRRLWRPMFLTSLCYIALAFGVGFITIFLMYAGMKRAETWALIILTECLCFAFQLGLVVPVLEGEYGWKALGKSWGLLEGKRRIAVRVPLLIFIVIRLLNISWTVVWRSVLSSTHLHPILLVIIKVVVQGAITSVGLLLAGGFETFFYFSCKAWHKESVTESDYFRHQVMQGAYEKASQLSDYPEV